MTGRLLVPATVLAVVAVACGGSGSSGASDEFCQAWIRAGLHEGIGSTTGEISDGIAQLTVIRDSAPDDLREEVDEARASLVALDEVLGRYDYSSDRLAEEASAADVATLDDAAMDVMALPAESETARFAHEGCVGVEDPRFLMGCPSTTAFTERAPSLLEPTSGDDTAVEDPDELADARVADYEDVDRWERRSSGGGRLEYALLAPGGRTLGLLEVTESAGLWEVSGDRACRGTS